MRRAAKVDLNQTLIVDALRHYGATVQSLAAIGKGCPDLLVGYRGKNYLLELKNDKAAKADQKLRPLQVEWHDLWHGRVTVVKTIDEAFAAIQPTVMTEWP